jgi:hypothetical protein
VFVTFVAALALGVLTSVAAASTAPSIAGVSVSGITEHDATLEAQIDPNGLETIYEFHIASPACQSEWPIVGPCFAISGFALPSATIPAGSGDQTIRVDINSADKTLQPGTWYEYAVTASNAAGKVTGYNADEGPGIGRNFAGGGGEQNFKTLLTSHGPISEGVSVPLNTAEPSATLVVGESPSGTGGNGLLGTSSTQPGSGVSPSTPLVARFVKAGESKVSIEAQKLAKALRLCEQKPRGRRACEKQARKAYVIANRKSHK